MNSLLEAFLLETECGEDSPACIYHLLDTYYQRVTGRIDELTDDETSSCEEVPFPEELLLPLRIVPAVSVMQ